MQEKAAYLFNMQASQSPLEWSFAISDPILRQRHVLGHKPSLYRATRMPGGRKYGVVSVGYIQPWDKHRL